MEKIQLKAIFWTFFKIGLFTFGGGYAMITLIQKEVVENHKWIEQDTLVKLIAIGESTPGPFAINCATFIGYKVRKFIGSVTATIAVVLPSLIIIMIIAQFFEQFKEIKAIFFAFKGIQAGVAVLIFNAFLKVLKNNPKNVISYLISLGALLLSLFSTINVIYIILCSALIGILYYSLTMKRGEIIE